MLIQSTCLTSLIPQRLGTSTMSLDLPFQRRMIGVLGDHRDTQFRHAATPRHHLGGTGRVDHRAIARASIFLVHMTLDDHVRSIAETSVCWIGSTGACGIERETRWGPGGNHDRV
jgi:hypothetical protein